MIFAIYATVLGYLIKAYWRRSRGSRQATFIVCHFGLLFSLVWLIFMMSLEIGRSDHCKLSLCCFYYLYDDGGKRWGFYA